MGYSPKYFGCDGLDGILSVENFDTSLAEGVMLLTPFSADASDDLTKNFVRIMKQHMEIHLISLQQMLTMQSIS